MSKDKSGSKDKKDKDEGKKSDFVKTDQYGFSINSPYTREDGEPYGSAYRSSD